jgi:hypothetical protein
VVVVDDEVVVDAAEGEVEDPSPFAGFAGVPASSVAVDPPSAPSADDPPVDGAGGRRSFLAQPDPLKWTAGAPIALRTGPEPQSGQEAGGSPYTPWIASNRRPQAEQS